MANPIDVSWRASWAHAAIREHIAALEAPSDGAAKEGTQMPVTGAVGIDSDHIPRLHLDLPEPSQNDDLKVGIVGGGCAGLFTAMIFNKLKSMLKETNIVLPVTCEIFEAAGKERLGGRVYTYQFPPHGPHDYYDVGAMRFPEITVMNRCVIFSLNHLR